MDYKEKIKVLCKNYDESIEFLDTQIKILTKAREKGISEIQEECRKTTGHKDNGGMFFYVCEYCGYADT